MKLGSEKSTSPKAEGSAKKTGGKGEVKVFGKVALPQHGGEGADKYKGQKSDMSLPQHGGEGQEKEGKITSDSGLLLKKPSTEYGGGGRMLGKA